MLMAEIISLKSLRRDLMHCRARVCNCAHFVCIEFLPPIEWSRNIHIHGNHPHEFSMVCPGVPQLHHKIEVVWTDFRIALSKSVTIPCRSRIEAITLLPRIHRISHPTDRMLPAHDLGVFEFNHSSNPPHTKCR